MINIKECCKYADNWEYLEDHFDIEIHPPHTEEDEEYFTDIGTFMAHYAYKYFLQSVIEGINKANVKYRIEQMYNMIEVVTTDEYDVKKAYEFTEYDPITEAKESAINYVLDAMR